MEDSMLLKTRGNELSEDIGNMRQQLQVTNKQPCLHLTAGHDSTLLSCSVLKCQAVVLNIPGMHHQCRHQTMVW